MVDLPAPLGPTSPTFSPLKTLIDASRKRICLPCCFETWSSRITRGRRVTWPRAVATGCDSLDGTSARSARSVVYSRRVKRYVAVAGTIGAGKTSLVAWLVKRYGLTPFYEPNEANPYLADFYAD